MMECLFVRNLFVTIVVLLIHQLSNGNAITIGVNQGFKGDNLPPPLQIADLYTRCQIGAIRIFEPNHDMLNSLRGKPQQVIVGTTNQEIQTIAQDPAAAKGWVNDNILAFINDVNIQYIAIGNEIIPGEEAKYVASAMNNIRNALNEASVQKDIKITTVLYGGSMANSYPPSAGAFNDETAVVLKDIVPILSSQNAPMLINVYPYLAYVSDTAHISLDYVMFKAQNPVVVDGNLQYYNLFDAMIDSFYAAFEKIGATNTQLLVSETGWPTAGNDPITSKENAKTFNTNLRDHVQKGQGTPRRPGQTLDVMLFAMFNEDLKPEGIERNWGLFYPDMSPVYPFWNC